MEQNHRYQYNVGSSGFLPRTRQAKVFKLVLENRSRQSSDFFIKKLDF